jgi:hypothetical protein
MPIQDQSAYRPLPQPEPVLRLTFGYEGDKITLLSEQEVTMIAPPSHPLERVESTSGFSVIVRDASGNPVYRRVVENPVRHDVEVFSPDPKQSIRRVSVQRPKGTFVILIPGIKGAQTLEFFGPPLRPQAHREPPQMLARFTLKTR